MNVAVKLHPFICVRVFFAPLRWCYSWNSYHNQSAWSILVADLPVLPLFCYWCGLFMCNRTTWGPRHTKLTSKYQRPRKLDCRVSSRRPCLGQTAALEHVHGHLAHTFYTYPPKQRAAVCICYLTKENQNTPLLLIQPLTENMFGLKSCRWHWRGATCRI